MTFTQENNLPPTPPRPPTHKPFSPGSQRRPQRHRGRWWEVNSACLLDGGVAVKYGLALSREGKCQTVTHAAKTDSSELCCKGSDFYKASDEWGKIWDNINELYRARESAQHGCIAKRVWLNGLLDARINLNLFQCFVFSLPLFFPHFFHPSSQISFHFALQIQKLLNMFLETSWGLYTIPLKFQLNEWKRNTNELLSIMTGGCTKNRACRACIYFHVCVSVCVCVCVCVCALIPRDHSWPRLQLSHLACCDVRDCGSLSTNKEKTLWRIKKGSCKYDWWGDDPMRWDPMRWGSALKSSFFLFFFLELEIASEATSSRREKSWENFHHDYHIFDYYSLSGERRNHRQTLLNLQPPLCSLGIMVYSDCLTALQSSVPVVYASGAVVCRCPPNYKQFRNFLCTLW